MTRARCGKSGLEPLPDTRLATSVFEPDSNGVSPANGLNQAIRGRAIYFSSFSDSSFLDRFQNHSAALPPIESRSAIISEGICSAAALRFSRRCLTDDVPGMSRMFGER